jgi:peptide/nickel transport system permease protein
MLPMRDARARFGIACLVVLGLIAVLAPWISSGDPSLQRDVVATRFLPPLTTDVNGMFHLLGTDRLGRDVWTRLAFGARVSLGVGLLGVSLSVVIGVLVGGVAGATRGVVSKGLLAATDFALALPRVVLLLLLATLWAPGMVLVIVVLGVTGWMPVARLVYGEVRKLMAMPFVDSAVALGASGPRVLTRHVLPNALTPVIAAAVLGVGNAITLEAGLSFLGVGVQPPSPSWGGMIASGRDALINAPWVAIAPGVMLVLVVVACTMVGDGLQQRGTGSGNQGTATA